MECHSQADALRTESQAGYGYLVERLNGMEQSLGERVGDVEQAVGRLQMGQENLQAGQRELQAGLTGLAG